MRLHAHGMLIVQLAISPKISGINFVSMAYFMSAEKPMVTEVETKRQARARERELQMLELGHQPGLRKSVTLSCMLQLIQSAAHSRTRKILAFSFRGVVYRKNGGANRMASGKSRRSAAE